MLGPELTKLDKLPEVDGFESATLDKPTEVDGLESTKLGRLMRFKGFESTKLGELTEADGFASTEFAKPKDVDGFESAIVGKLIEAGGFESTALVKAAEVNGFESANSSNLEWETSVADTTAFSSSSFSDSDNLGILSGGGALGTFGLMVFCPSEDVSVFPYFLCMKIACIFAFWMSSEDIGRLLFVGTTLATGTLRPGFLWSGCSTSNTFLRSLVSTVY